MPNNNSFTPLEYLFDVMEDRAEDYIDVHFWNTFSWWYIPDLTPYSVLERFFKRFIRRKKPEFFRWFKNDDNIGRRFIPRLFFIIMPKKLPKYVRRRRNTRPLSRKTLWSIIRFHWIGG